MPFVDPTHQHFVSSVLDDDTHTPIDPGGSGATPTLAEVLAEGNDPDGHIIRRMGGIFAVQADANDDVHSANLEVNANTVAAQVALNAIGASGLSQVLLDGEAGTVGLAIGNDTGTLGQVLTAQGDGSAIWDGPHVAAYCDPLTSDIADVIAALIAAGLMAGPA